MNLSEGPHFRKLASKLPKHIRAKLTRALATVIDGSAELKQLKLNKHICYSLRLSDNYRVLFWQEGKDELVCLWTGTHAEYDRVIKKL